MFTETLPTLQAIFYPVQGQDLSIRQMVLLSFRDQVLLKLHLEEDLRRSQNSFPSITQMLLVLQGVHETSLEYFQLERLLEIVVSPYLNNMVPGEKAVEFDSSPPPEITISSSVSERTAPHGGEHNL